MSRPVQKQTIVERPSEAMVNIYTKLPIEAALKEALYELGATSRTVNAVSSERLAKFLVERGFPKKRGRTYEPGDHEREVAADLLAIAKTRPMHGWHYFVGGHSFDPWNNYAWNIPEAELQERPCKPAPPTSEALEQWKDDEQPAAPARKTTAAEVQAGIPKITMG